MGGDIYTKEEKIEDWPKHCQRCMQDYYGPNIIKCPPIDCPDYAKEDPKFLQEVT